MNLTTKQQIIFDEVGLSNFLKKNFYFNNAVGAKTQVQNQLRGKGDSKNL